MRLARFHWEDNGHVNDGILVHLRSCMLCHNLERRSGMACRLNHLGHGPLIDCNFTSLQGKNKPSLLSSLEEEEKGGELELLCQGYSSLDKELVGLRPGVGGKSSLMVPTVWI